MAQSSPIKLRKKKVNTYSSCLLSDTKLAHQMLCGLSIATCNPCAEEDEPAAVSEHLAYGSGDVDEKVAHTVSTRMSCAYCAVEFSSRSEQRSHFKSDWHRYNLKLQLKGENSITEETFEAMSGDISSISGSGDSSDSSSDTDNVSKPSPVPTRLKNSNYDSTDSETEGSNTVLAAVKKYPKIFMRNSNGQLVSLYRCVLYHKKTAPATQAELLSMANQALDYTRVAIIMLAGGHFAAAVFDRKEAVVHKTFHRYVVRAKRGTLQSVRDNQGNAPKSGGASLRRYNEAALALEIQELLTSWSAQMKGCHLIFLRTSTYSKKIFFGGKTPALDKNDLRIRTIPFSTCRPTFNEVKRVYQNLTSVECYGDEAAVMDFVPVSPPRHINRDSGQLEVGPDRADRRKDKNKTASEKETAEATPEMVTSMRQEAAGEVGGEASEESEGEIELVETVIEIQTEGLKEFDISIPNRNKRKMKKSNKKTNVAKSAQSNLSEAEEANTDLKNRLYTACKCGDLSLLSQLLTQLQLSGPQPAAPTAHHNNMVTVGSSVTRAQHLGDGTADTVAESPVVTEQYGSSVDPAAAMKKGGDLNATDKNVRQVDENTCVSSGLEDETTQNAHVSTSPESGMKSSVSICDTQTQHSSSNQTENASSGGSGESRPHRLLNEVYGEKRSTLLHFASMGGHVDIVHALLEAGCDPAIKDSGGKPPFAVAGSKETRNAFRRFRGNNPDMYNYDTAQIPSALTDELEAERKQREAERKKAQRKARNERLKEKKAEESKLSTEQREKNRFLALTDREKRALAAERRLIQQASSQGGAVPVMSRCFQCAVDMTGKVPFEYMDYKFCTTMCLRNHRAKCAK